MHLADFLHAQFRANGQLVFSQKEGKVILTFLEANDNRVFELQGRLATIFLGLNQGLTLKDILSANNWDKEAQTEEGQNGLVEAVKYLVDNQLLLGK